MSNIKTSLKYFCLILSIILTPGTYEGPNPNFDLVFAQFFNQLFFCCKYEKMIENLVEKIEKRSKRFLRKKTETREDEKGSKISETIDLCILMRSRAPESRSFWNIYLS